MYPGGCSHALARSGGEPHDCALEGVDGVRAEDRSADARDDATDARVEERTGVRTGMEERRDVAIEERLDAAERARGGPRGGRSGLVAA